MPWIGAILCISALCVASALSAAAQGVSPSPEHEAQAQLTFEVVSVKPYKPEGMQSRILINPDGISLSGIPLSVIMRLAFGVWSDRIIGAPTWVNSSRFDIEAKIAAEEVPAFKNAKPDERSAMLLPVIQDRFGLKFHHETRDLAVYTLVIAKGGAKIKEADLHRTDPTEFGTPDLPSGSGVMRMMPSEFNGREVPIQSLVHALSLVVDKTVVDKTGLTRRYDFDMKWEPDLAAGLVVRGFDGNGPPPGAESPSQGTGPSIFTALQEELGLKLVTKKQPIDVIVIDQIEQPTPN